MPAPTDAAVEGTGWRLAHRGVTRFADWAANSYGSSHSSALIRIGIAMLFWSRWAGELLLYRDLSATGLFLSVNFFIATTLLFVGYHSRIAAVWTGVVGLPMYTISGTCSGVSPGPIITPIFWPSQHFFA